ncbi:MAG: Nucleoside recognition domain protein [Clostridia bacterium 62_21]|nr:MAG: Nucleoside recognition domain protein [Clostridia bacterium 62_21]HAG07391.1 nucleoside recognition protein [Peptococcaceae bacterium]
MDFGGFARELVRGAGASVLEMACFIIPIMLFIEILRDLNILPRVAALMDPLFRWFRMSKDAYLPLVAGIFFGLAFGAGVIIQAVRDGNVNRRDLYIVNTFLVICHSIVDDTILFISIGANGFLILVPRILLAFLVCLAVARLYRLIRRPQIPESRGERL